jgi:hypothetical protein
VGRYDRGGAPSDEAPVGASPDHEGDGDGIMTAPTVHLKGYDLDPDLPLSQQATSLAAEIEAAHVFQDAAHRDLAAGDIRALARIAALDEHEQELRNALLRIENPQHDH